MIDGRANTARSGGTAERKRGIGWGQFLRAIGKARWAILTVFLGCVLAALIAVEVIPRAYTATARVTLGIETPDKVTGSFVPDPSLPNYVGTLAYLVSDLSVGVRAAEILGWTTDPQSQAQWQSQGAPGEFQLWLAQIITNRTQVQMVPNSSIMEISYTTGDPEAAKQIVLAVRSAFVETALKNRAASAGTTADLLAKQAAYYQQQLEAAQSRLIAYQRDHGLLVTGATSTEDQDMLVETQKSTAQAQANMATSGLSAGQGGAGSAIAVQQLEGQIAQLDAQLASIAQLGTQHPTYKALTSRRATLQSELDRAQAAQRNAASSGYEATAKASQDLATQVARQGAVVASLDDKRSELGKLRSDVALAQQKYDEMLQREAWQRMLADRTEGEFVIIGDAVLLPEPTFPNVPLTMGLAIGFGGALAVLCALFGEVLAMRVRSRRALALAANTDVLAIIGDAAPARPDRIRRLFARTRSNPSLEWHPAQ